MASAVLLGLAQFLMQSKSKKADEMPSRRKSVNLRLPGNTGDLNISDLEIFSKLQIYIDLGKDAKETTRKMRKLARAFGATVLIPFSPNVNSVVTNTENEEAIRLAEPHGIPCVNVRWILDSVGRRTLMPLDQYLIIRMKGPSAMPLFMGQATFQSPKRACISPTQMARAPAIVQNKPSDEAMFPTPNIRKAIKNGSPFRMTSRSPMFRQYERSIERQNSSRSVDNSKTLGERIQLLMNSNKGDSQGFGEETRLRPPYDHNEPSTPNDNADTNLCYHFLHNQPQVIVRSPVNESGSRKRRTLKPKTDFKMSLGRPSLKSVSKRRFTMNKVDLDNPLPYLEYVEKKIKKALDL